MNKQNNTKIDWNNLTVADLQFQKTAHFGHNVSHAKNRTNRKFKRNLHRTTVVIDGQKHRVEVPTGVLKKLKAHGYTTHFKNDKA